jgi:hypothetical protein
MHHDIPPGAQCFDSILLPRVRQRQLLCERVDDRSTEHGAKHVATVVTSIPDRASVPELALVRAPVRASGQVRALVPVSALALAPELALAPVRALVPGLALLPVSALAPGLASVQAPGLASVQVWASEPGLALVPALALAVEPELALLPVSVWLLARGRLEQESAALRQLLQALVRTVRLALELGALVAANQR